MNVENRYLAAACKIVLKDYMCGLSFITRGGTQARRMRVTKMVEVLPITCGCVPYFIPSRWDVSLASLVEAGGESGLLTHRHLKFTEVLKTQVQAAALV